MPVPVELFLSASYPTAVIKFAVLNSSALVPIPVLLFAVVPNLNTPGPIAVLFAPVVLESKELLPIAILLPPLVLF